MSVSSATKNPALDKETLTCFLCQKLFFEPMLLNCGHSFCLKCIEKWLRKCTNCPLCRVPTLQPTHNVALNKTVTEFKEAERHNTNVFQRSIAQPLMRSLRGQRRGNVSKQAKSMQRETISAERRQKEIRTYLKNKTLTTDTVVKTECSPNPLKPHPPAVSRVLETSFNGDDDDAGQGKNISPYKSSAGIRFKKEKLLNRPSTDRKIIAKDHLLENILDSGTDYDDEDDTSFFGETSNTTSRSNDEIGVQRSFSRLRQKISYKVNAIGYLPTPPPRTHLPDRVNDLSRPALRNITQQTNIVRPTPAVRTHKVICGYDNKSFMQDSTDQKLTDHRRNLPQMYFTSEETKFITSAIDNNHYPNDIYRLTLTHTQNDSVSNISTASSPSPQIALNQQFSSIAEKEECKNEGTFSNGSNSNTITEYSSGSKSDNCIGRHSKKNKAIQRSVNPNNISIVVISLVDVSELLYHIISQAFAVNFGCVEFVDVSELLYTNKKNNACPKMHALMAADLTVLVYSAQDENSVNELLKILEAINTAAIFNNVPFALLDVNDGECRNEQKTKNMIEDKLAQITSRDVFYQVDAANMSNELPTIINGALLREKYFRGIETGDIFAKLSTSNISSRFNSQATSTADLETVGRDEKKTKSRNGKSCSIM